MIDNTMRHVNFKGRTPAALVGGLGVFMAVLALADVNQLIVRDEHFGGVVDRGIVFENEEITMAFVRKVATDLVNLDGSSASTLMQLVIAPTREALAQAYVKSRAVSSFESLEQGLQSSGVPRGPIARILIVQGRVKLSFLSKDGVFNEEILSPGADPAVFQMGEDSLEVLHLRLTMPGPALQTSAVALNVFLRSTPVVSLRHCVSVLERLHAITGVERLTVNVRRDPWFVDEQYYPLLMPFVKPSIAPSAFQARFGPAVRCGYSSGRISCSGTDFAP